MPVGLPKVKQKSTSSRSAQKVNGSEKKYEIEERAARNLDDLALHDELFVGVLGSLKKDISNGMSTVDILKKYSALAAARTVTVALTDEDSGKALSASKDILDRVQGKATEIKKIEHALAKSDEKEIDAVLLSKLNQLEAASDEQEE